jgi:hypothetical protein
MEKYKKVTVLKNLYLKIKNMTQLEESNPQWINFAENKRRAAEVIQSLENRETYTPTFVNGMYYGLLIALNAEEQKNADLQIKLLKQSYDVISNLSFFGRLKFCIKFLFTKKLL